MKKVIFVLLLAAGMLEGFAQEDTTGKKSETPETSDTIRVGGIIILKKGGNKSGPHVYDEEYSYKRRNYHRDKVTTNWLIIDLGYSGYNDRTNYNTQEAQDFIANAGNEAVNKGDFSIKGTRISNFNLWFFMQKRSLYKNIINLKYGFGIENTNYYYKTPITYVDGGNPYVIRDSILFSKNKIAADYFTIPMMLNFNTNPERRHGGFNVSVGASISYLYSSRQKQESDERGKQKNHSDFNLRPWKFAWVAELGLGPVKFYGTYAMNTLHEYGVDQYPYTVGIRFSTF